MSPIDQVKRFWVWLGEYGKPIFTIGVFFIALGVLFWNFDCLVVGISVISGFLLGRAA